MDTSDCLYEWIPRDQEAGGEAVAKSFYFIAVVLIADTSLAQQQVTVFVEKSKYLRPFNGLSVVDANRCQIITKDGKAAQLLGRL
ncbi:MAG TPA: hypothetical protein VMX16_18885 [Terriglobia bacterium]|nr:hypothetical protein [Terriglobia bacterium]